MTAAMAAGLVAMVARSSSRLPDADTVAQEADRLRARAVDLADEDGRTYAEVLAAAPHREAEPQRFTDAVAAANLAPGEVTELAERITELGERLVADGARKLRGDAIVGVVLGEAAAIAATELIALNTAYGQLSDDDLGRARARRDACGVRVERVRTVA